MALTRLMVTQFRNIQHADINFHPRLNLIYGENGAGKTSLLEAISYVGLGRSFRTRKFASVIQSTFDQFSLFAELGTSDRVSKIGFQKDRSGTTRIKINGESASKATELARLAPVRVLNSQSFQLLEGGPNERRRFLDWLVFHVKHEYAEIWASGLRCLKQRNALLKRFSSPKYSINDLKQSEELVYWSGELSNFTEQIARLRSEVLYQYLPVVKKYYSLHADQTQIGDNENLLRIELNHGWRTDANQTENQLLSKQGYENVLEKNLERDRRLGFTSSGFHKADLSFFFENQPVSEIFSRGQLKRFISALLIAQVDYVSSMMNKDCLLLIDDLPAELDSHNQKLIAGWVLSLKNVQVFITGIHLKVILSEWPEDIFSSGYNMFHVKHGTINNETMYVE